MDHPIRGEERLALRKKFADLLKRNYDLVRHDNIVFVCGGNEAHHARTRFLAIAPELLKEYDLFTPEIALANAWRDGDGPFELTNFESLIAEVSAAVVVFPESAGSICETGFFAAKKEILAKTVLAIDRQYQVFESFISTGPLNLINEGSNFRPAEYIDYNGNFEIVIERIKKRRPKTHRIAVRVDSYSELTFIQKMGAVQKTVEMLTLATRSDIEFMFRSAFSSHVSSREINGLISILHGSNYLIESNDFGHFRSNPSKPSFLEIRKGGQGFETEVAFEIAEASEGSVEFSNLLSELQNAA